MSNETKSLEELAQPVQIFKHPAGRNHWLVSADSNAGQPDVEPFYSQEYVDKLRLHIARQEQILMNQDESLSIRRGELESAQQRIAELEAIKTAAEKLVRCRGRYHSEQNYRALAALFGVTTPDLAPVEGDA